MGLSVEHRHELEKSMKDMNLSETEADKLAKAFKDPEFLKIFEEYAREITDPKVKAEQDAYLRQLESEGRAEETYGKGMQLVVPEEAFVIKTSDKKTKEKAFINICTSEKIDKLKFATVASSGDKGQRVEIPFSLGLRKAGSDKQGKPCSIWNFVVHPETVTVARARPAVLNLLAETAIEQIDNRDKTRLSIKFKIPNLKYKATEASAKPEVLAVRTDASAQSSNGRFKPMPSASAAKPPAATAPSQDKDVPAAANGSVDQQKSKGSAFKFPAPQSKATASSTPLVPSEPGFQHGSGEVTPTWELVHRGELDLTQAWADTGKTLAVSSYPKELVLRISLPELTSAATVDLTVSQKLVLAVVPTKYRLELSLRYDVDESKGKAKFHKDKRILELVLPVLPPKLEALPQLAPTCNLQQADETSTSDDALTVIPAADSLATGDRTATGSACSSSSHGECAGEIAASSSTISAAAPNQGDTVSGFMQGGAGSNRSVEETTAQPCNQCQQHDNSCTSDPTAQLTDNQRRWLELHAAQSTQAQAVEDCDPTDSRTSASAYEADTASTLTVQKGLNQLATASNGTTVEQHGIAVNGESQGSCTDAAERALTALASAGVVDIPTAPAGSLLQPSRAAPPASALHLKPRLTKALAEELD